MCSDKPRPAKRRKTTDEDDFIAPSDADSEPDIMELQSQAGSHSTKSISRRVREIFLNGYVLISSQSSVMDEDDEEIIEQSKPKARGNAKVFCSTLYCRLSSHMFTACQATYAPRNSYGLLNGYWAPHCCRATRPNKEGREEGCGTTLLILAGYQRREHR